jgi:hypothetical protein
MAKENIFLKMVTFVIILGVPALLFSAVVYGNLSPREWAICLLAWSVILILWATLKQRAGKKVLVSSAGPASTFDDDTRKRISRGIWMRKVLIGVLALLLVVGITNGVAHHAYFPTLAGGGMNLLWMYVTAQQIKRLRDRIDNQRQVP